jgi:hypothetical protein
MLVDRILAGLFDHCGKIVVAVLVFGGLFVWFQANLQVRPVAGLSMKALTGFRDGPYLPTGAEWSSERRGGSRLPEPRERSVCFC